MKIVTAAIIWRKSRVLLTRRASDESLGGFWEFPGGKLEGDETHQACLKREIHEETALDILPGEVFAESVYSYDHGAIRLVAITATIVSGEIRLTVHDRFEWVPPQDLLKYKLAPADIPIAEKLMERPRATFSIACFRYVGAPGQ